MKYFQSLLAGCSAALMLASTNGWATEIVNVSSLSELRAAIDTAPSSGRSIVLERGIYEQSSPINIRNKSHITIRGATADYADTVIRGPGINDRSLGINFRVSRSDNVTLENLTVQDSYFHAVQVTNDADHFTARNIKAFDNGEAGFKITSPANGRGDVYSDFGMIENSVIGFSETGQRNVVEGVDIVGAKGWTVRGNEFENIRKPDGRAAYAAFAKGNAQDIIFEKNVIQNSFIALSFGGGGTGAAFFRDGDTRYETRGGIIRNNLIYNVDDAGIYLNKARDFEVLGNTVINNGQGTGAVESRFPESSGLIADNILSSPIKRRDGGTAIARNNTFVPDDTPIPEPPNQLPEPDITPVSAPSGSMVLSLFALSLGGMGLAHRRRFSATGKND